MIPIFLLGTSNNTTQGVAPQPPGGGTSGLDAFPGIGLPNSPPPRWQGNIAYVQSQGGSILFGGKSTSTTIGLLNDVWFWNGFTWVQFNTTNIPPTPRSEAAMSFDGANVTLFGGSDTTNNQVSDTWVLNDLSWVLKNTGVSNFAIPNNPSRIKGAGFSYQSGAGLAFLFGGKNTLTYLNTTWSWNQSTGVWTKLTPPLSPPRRAYHAQASSSSATVIFGGMGSGQLFNDTWSFDGNFWLGLGTANQPSARHGAAMVYDSGNNIYVLFGGSTATSYNNETWTFNPVTSTWTQITTPFNSTPLRRAYAQMAYDSIAGKTVLFGGIKDDEDLNDTWLFNSTTNTWSPQ